MGRRTKAASAAVVSGAVALGAWAAPAGAQVSSDQQHVDHTFTARNGEEVTCRVAGRLDLGRSTEPPFVDIAGSVAVTGDDLCRESLLSVGVSIEYRRADQQALDELHSGSDTAATASVSARVQGDVTGEVRGLHGAAFRCLIDGSALICPTQVRTSAK